MPPNTILISPFIGLLQHCVEQQPTESFLPELTASRRFPSRAEQLTQMSLSCRGKPRYCAQWRATSQEIAPPTRQVPLPAYYKSEDYKGQHYKKCAPKPLRPDATPQYDMIEFLALAPRQLAITGHIVIAGNFPPCGQPVQSRVLIRHTASESRTNLQAN